MTKCGAVELLVVEMSRDISVLRVGPDRRCHESAARIGAGRSAIHAPAIQRRQQAEHARLEGGVRLHQRLNGALEGGRQGEILLQLEISQIEVGAEEK